MDLLLDRFLRYVSFETRADEKADQTPSSKGQHQLAAHLVEELKSLGLEDASADQHAYVTARLAGNTTKPIPTIALIAHLDTAPDLPGKNDDVNIFIYEGGDIALQSGDIISPSDFPQLTNMVGETLLTSKGDSLLGADNKAGVAIIMTVIDRLRDDKRERGDIAVVFTPDEEIGHGADLLDLDAIGASFGFTIDGGELGEFETENFNAAKATVTVKGRITHPGSAKDVMVNACLIVTELVSMLPVEARPELTANREGFFMVDKIDASIEDASLEMIIRDHSSEKFEEKKQTLEAAVSFLKQKHGDRLSLSLQDQYYNMASIMKEHPYIIELADQAMRDQGIVPKRVPVRGGTDGARLSYRGLPCPNIFTGGYNFHNKMEFASLDQMNKAVDVVCGIVRQAAMKEWE